MAQDFYIAKQPIIDLKGETYGYELLFRALDSGGQLRAIFKDELLATAKVLVNALNHFGMHSLVNDNLAFVNIDQEFLMDPMILSIPKDRFVLEILEDTIIDERTIERIRQLKEIGYRLALDDVYCSDGFVERFTPIFPYIDILKLDVSLMKENTLENYLENFKSYNFKMLAEKVETKEDLENTNLTDVNFFKVTFLQNLALYKKSQLTLHTKKYFS